MNHAKIKFPNQLVIFCALGGLPLCKVGRNLKKIEFSAKEFSLIEINKV